MTTPVDLTPLGLAVGHATDEAGATGLTVVRGIDGPLRAGVAKFGRATGSREWFTASVDHVAGGRVDAIVLTGGSAYGLDATAGVMRWMEEHDRGFEVGRRLPARVETNDGWALGPDRPQVVPIVPAAVVFDLLPLGSFDARPTPKMAYEACEHASPLVVEGCVGVGTGVTVGKMLGGFKSGFGCAVDAHEGGFAVAAMAVVNAFGDVRDGDGRIIAGARTPDGRFVDTMWALPRMINASSENDDLTTRNTTLVVIACSVPLGATALTQLAHAAGAGLFRRITPVATSSDGDVVFAVSPLDGQEDAAREMQKNGVMAQTMLESLVVPVVEQAIERAVRSAKGRDGIPGLAD